MARVVDQNPALNPTREWSEGGDVDAVVEAGFLIRNLPPMGQSTLTILASNPNRIFTLSELGELLGNVSSETVRAIITKANQFAEAFGFVPIINIEGSSYKVTSISAEVIRRALEREA